MGKAIIVNFANYADLKIPISDSTGHLKCLQIFIAFYKWNSYHLYRN